jgi:hypothetical protein
MFDVISRYPGKLSGARKFYKQGFISTLQNQFFIDQLLLKLKHLPTPRETDLHDMHSELLVSGKNTH